MSTNKHLQELFESPLYVNFENNEEVFDLIHKYLAGLEYHTLAVDLYCPQCRNHSIFNPNRIKQMPNDQSFHMSPAFFKEIVPLAVIEYSCSRHKEHIVYLNLLKKGKMLIKIGQFPAKANIDFPEFNKYSNIMPEIVLSDLKKGCGLASHGAGAGSFVYLRRVFEYLLKSTYDSLKNEININETTFQSMRVNEKIKLLSDSLPTFMTENIQIYGILSLGVHELSEEQCIKNFDIMKSTIEIILDQVLEKKQKEEKQLKIMKSISNLSTELKNV